MGRDASGYLNWRADSPEKELVCRTTGGVPVKYQPKADDAAWYVEYMQGLICSCDECMSRMERESFEEGQRAYAAIDWNDGND